MKIYTRTGDKGQTGLLGGARVAKNSHRIHAIGEVDELNAWLGYVRSQNIPSKLEEILHRLQRSLFCFGAELANPGTSSIKIPTISHQEVQYLEQCIDELDAELQPLEHFILPGGGEAGSILHISRAVCRRAERAITALQEQEDISPTLLIFLNRLSDLLFVMARWSNMQENIKEEEWKANT